MSRKNSPGGDCCGCVCSNRKIEKLRVYLDWGSQGYETHDIPIGKSMSELGGFFPFYLGDVWSMQPRTSGGPTPIQSITISITFNNTSALPFSVKQPTASKAQAKVTVDAGVSQEIRWNDERYYANNTSWSTLRLPALFTLSLC